MNNKIAVIYLMLVICMLTGCGKAKKNDIGSTMDPQSNQQLNGDKEEINKTGAKGLIEEQVRDCGDFGIMRDLTATEIVADMRIGWNLGNTFDSIGTETSWGNPKTTKEMIDAVASAGFNTIRIPVTWYGYMGEAPEYTVDETWLARIGEVIDYCMDNKMYVILNTHHEDEWLLPKKEGYEAVEKQFIKLWEQIGNYYAGYGDYLLFEGMNEPRIKGGLNEWNGGTSEGREIVNKLNSVFIDTVRSTGGNNETRSLLVTTFAAQAHEMGMKELIVSKDNNIIVSIHAYMPYRFTYYNNETWDLKEWDGTANNEIASLFKSIDNHFISNGIPVIITEYGAVNKLQVDGGENNLQARSRWVSYYLMKAREYGIPCIWWDNGYYESGNELFGIFNRLDKKFYEPELLKAMMWAVDPENKLTADESFVDSFEKSSGNIDEAGRAIAQYGTPIIDGVIEDQWDSIEEISPKVIVGSNVTSTGSIKLLWDEDYLYTLFIVYDKDLDLSGINDYEQDSVELFLDESNDKGVAYQSDDVHYRVNYEGWNTNPSGDKSRWNTSVSLIQDDGGNVIGYVAETSVKWNAEPERGKVVGFDLQINDAANGVRKGTLTAFDSTGTAWNVPSAMGELILN